MVVVVYTLTDNVRPDAGWIFESQWYQLYGNQTQRCRPYAILKNSL